MTQKASIVLIFLIEIVFIFDKGVSVPIKSKLDRADQNLSFEDKTFSKYAEDLLVNYNYKHYFSILFDNEPTRQDFVKFLNEGLTEQVKNDLAGLRINKTVGDSEVPVVVVSSQMDAWLGVLPQWKRTKRFLFTKIQEYLALHPELLH